jgi:hypothetical protein
MLLKGPWSQYARAPYESSREVLAQTGADRPVEQAFERSSVTIQCRAFAAGRTASRVPREIALPVIISVIVVGHRRGHRSRDRQGAGRPRIQPDRDSHACHPRRSHRPDHRGGPSGTDDSALLVGSYFAIAGGAIVLLARRVLLRMRRDATRNRRNGLPAESSYSNLLTFISYRREEAFRATPDGSTTSC